jgi:N-acetylglucosamine kinase-like BadF-type ATPase
MDDSNEYADFAGTVSRSYVSEAQAALALAGERCGIVVLAGTGAFVYGETRDGRICHLDSLGPILGDYGSGYYIGHLALRAAARSGWGDRHRTSLREAIYAACGVDMATERVIGSGLEPFSLMNPDRAEIASFAQIVDREAEAGDRIAVEILKTAASAIAETLRDVVDALEIGDQEYPMVGTGGVVHSRIYWQHLSGLATEIAPGLKPFVSNLPAVVGVALASLQKFGSCDPQVTADNLIRSITERNSVIA